MAKPVSTKQKAEMFLMLEECTLLDTAKAFGFDKRYSSDASTKVMMNKLYKEVRQDPLKYGLTQQDVDRVGAKVDSRTLALKQDVHAVENIGKPTINIRELATENRDRAGKLISKFLANLESNDAKLMDMNLSTLATTFGILFDKAQIARGEATENIAVIAKIDKNISPADALASILKMRELHIEDKNPDNKK